jgi:hypothetical protein
VAKGKEEVKKEVKPPRVLSSYIYFSNAMVPKIKADEGLSHKDAMSRAGEIWRSYNEDDKKPYTKLQEDDQKRYISRLLTI